MSGRNFTPWLAAALFCILSSAEAFADNFIQDKHLKATFRKADSNYGESIAISGNTMVVGAYGDSSGAVGINGDEEDGSKPYAGAVHVYVRSGGEWVQQAYLKASNPDEYDYFGQSVAIEGDTIVVGAPYEASNSSEINGNQYNNDGILRGAVYVFVRTGTTWTQQAYLKPNTTNEWSGLGHVVAISGDTILAGAQGESIFPNGDHEDFSQVDLGAVYVFKRNGTSWSQEARLTANNQVKGNAFGTAVSISGDTTLIGAAYRPSESSGGLYEGAAYIFRRTGGTWTQEAYLKAPHPDAGDYFGYSVAINGDRAFISAPGEASGDPDNPEDDSRQEAGAAYVFTRSGNIWSFTSYLKPENPIAYAQFGLSISIQGELVLVGAPLENGQSGAIYAFVKEGENWKRIDKITSPDALLGTGMFGSGQGAAGFGFSSAIYKNTLVIGCPLDWYVVHPGPITFASVGSVLTYSLSMPKLAPSGLRLESGDIKLSFTSLLDGVFSVQASSDISGEWTVLGTARKAASGRYEFNDSTAGSVSSRFYRLRMDY